MRHFYSALICLCFFYTKAQINYSFNAVSGSFSALAGSTQLHGASIDDAISASTAIGFTFQYGCVNYTTFQASTNGVMFLGTTAAGSNLTNNLNTNFDRPAIGPLWDDLKTSTTGKVSYLLSGSAPNRILTIEWLNMLWSYTAAGPVISFQVKLYEGTNRIEFIYRQDANAVVVNGASIGLAGQTSGDFYSLNGTGASPSASKVTETTNLSTKPATGQIYRWDPVSCSGTPAGGIASASPSVSCGTFTSNLSLSGSTSGCGITYQWQSASSLAGPWSNIGGATSTTANVTSTSTTYYRCLVTCGASTGTSSAATASVNAAGSCGLCNVNSITLPYTATGLTNCGNGNNVTSTNVTNICGSSLYYGGEDAVYSFTPSFSGAITVSVNSTGSWMGVTVYQGCPVSGGTCLGAAQSSAGNQTLCATVTAGQAYYVVLDSWPAPTCNPYDIYIYGCSGSATGGTAVATPTLRCSSYTSTLSLSGASTSCGITYQWQSAPAATGPWTNIAGATSNTAAVTVSATTYYQCVLSCAGSTVASSVATASIQPSGGCGICGIVGVTLPYGISGQTTCGANDDVTATNVSTICGSSSYYGGEDVTYSFTPTSSGTININVSSSGSSMGITLYQGCPVSGGACVAQAQGASGTQVICSANVVAGQTYYLTVDSWPFPTCNPYDINISAPTGTNPPCNMNYSASSTTYSFETFTGTSCPSTDDVLYTNSISFGFPMCYDGSQYYSGYIASNCAFVFDAVPCFPNIQSGTYAAPGIGTGYTITGPAPVNNTSIPRNAILAPWHDSNPGLGGVIQYTTVGTAPNRRFIISYENVPMFSCGTSSPSIYFSGQIKLFETTNDIEIHIKNKGVCPGWNNGQAVMGLHNYNGTIYIPPVNATAHNATATTPYNQWTMTNTAYKFTNNCGSICAAILPINFEKFYGERKDKINRLYWHTADEKNVASFKVERSTDAKNFMEIGSLKPNNAPSKYLFEDDFSVPGVVNYYRITSVETDGTRKSTFVYPLGANDGEVAITGIIPNPVKDNFSVGIDSRVRTSAFIHIYDAYGKLVKSYTKDIGTGISQIDLNADDLSAGVYLLEVLSPNKEILAKQKLVKVN